MEEGKKKVRTLIGRNFNVKIGDKGVDEERGNGGGGKRKRVKG